MRQLTIGEIQVVSGSGFFDTFGAMVLGGCCGFTSGFMKMGIAGGATGGILGVGVISALVASLAGGTFIGIQGMLYGMVNGWDPTVEWFNQNTAQWFDNNSPMPK